MNDDAQQIRELVKQWGDATKRGDTKTVLGLMTDDAVFLVAGRAPMTKSEFAALSEGQPGAPKPEVDVTNDIQELIVSGDWAFMRSKLRVAVRPPGGAQPMTRAGHTLTVFKKENGRWLLARDANLLTPAKE